MFYPALFCVSVEGRELHLHFLARHTVFIIIILHCTHQRTATATRIKCGLCSGLFL
jgi:hypothetical protein